MDLDTAMYGSISVEKMRLSPREAQQAWFEVKFFYVKVDSCQGDAVPQFLTVRYLPRCIGTELEVNGGRIPPSEYSCVHLRKDRFDAESAEVTYVSTDNLRASGSVAFEILDEEELLLAGSLEQTQMEEVCLSPSSRGDSFALCDDGFESQTTKGVMLGWSMDCSCAVGAHGCSFTKNRHDYSASAVNLAPPSMEICVVGRYLGSPLVLTHTLCLTPRRRSSMRRGTLDAIPEGEVLDRDTLTLILANQTDQAAESRGVLEYDEDKVAGALNYHALDGFDNDDGHLSWFNTGVRVGVGLGLGMCIGIGLGVGLIIRSYQATTRTFRRRFF